MTLFTDNTYSFENKTFFDIHTVDITAVKKKIPLNPQPSYVIPSIKP
jgi:hypothetical protein